MAFASCSQFEHGYFAAYRRMAEDQPDLILHLGDYQYEHKTVATELVSTSITSGGDGSEVRPETPAILAENPHVKYFNNRRGYMRTKITAREVRADFRGLDHVRTPGAPVTTKASFVVEDRNPGLNRG